MRRLLLVFCVFLAFAPGSARASVTMQIGAAEDEGRNADPAVAQAKMDLAKAAGFDAIRVTAIWAPGESAVPPDQLAALQSVSAAAAVDGITIWTTVMPYGSRTTPLTTTARRQFASFAADLVRQVPGIPYVIVGNEPNINRYWLPQFTTLGADAAAPSYEKLLAQTYDAIKRVNRNEFVVGGSVSPHGSDDPTNIRQTHSPTAFITDLGDAYRASGRKKPIMDGFAFHPYGENSSVAPTETHPNSTTIGLADYDKLVSLLGQAFDGTAQAGSTLPIVYDEYGIESLIPPGELTLYHGREPSTTKPVPARTQGDDYDEALTMAACQRNVMAMFLFHVTDETDLGRWQSGVYYPDGTPKPSRAVVQHTIDQIRSHGVDCSSAVSDNGTWVEAGSASVSSSSGRAKPHKRTKKVRPAPAGVWKLIGGF
jgi:hypothetical protein